METNQSLPVEIRYVLDNYLLKLSAYLREDLLELRDAMVASAEKEILETMDTITSNQLKQALLEFGTPEKYALKLLQRLTGDEPKTA